MPFSLLETVGVLFHLLHVFQCKRTSQIVRELYVFMKLDNINGLATPPVNLTVSHGRFISSEVLLGLELLLRFLDRRLFQRAQLPF